MNQFSTQLNREPEIYGPVHLLIVDDSPGILESISAVFKNQGYLVKTAANGSEALRLAAEMPFDVALLDYTLPDISGLEVLRQLSQIQSQIGCIIMTAYATIDTVLEAMNVNARGFVTKPLDISSVIVKVAEVARTLRVERENKHLLSRLAAKVPRLEQSYDREHRIAEMLQRALQPGLPDHVGSLELAGTYIVGLQEAQIGGDIYDVVRIGSGQISILIADVSGKGLTAAAQMGMVHYTTRALGIVFLDPGQVVRHLHRVICSHSDAIDFVTLFYGIFDERTGVLRYVNAGHELPIWRQKSANKTVYLETTGPVVGVSSFQEDSFEVGEIRLNDGDSILLYTDGLSELRLGSSFLGLNQIATWYGYLSSLRPAEAVEHLFDLAHRYSAGEVRDDLAILCLKYHTSLIDREEAVEVSRC